jgi:hypothetical protein
VTETPVLRPAKTPLSPGRITAAGVTLAFATIALGLVGLHDALVSADVLDEASWIENGIDFFDGLEPQWWAVPAGIVAVLLGLWLLTVALRPRPRTAVSLRSRTGVFLRPRDVGRLAVRAAEEVDGVLDAKVSTSRRAARVDLTVTGDDARVEQEVQDVVRTRLAALDPAPRLRIRRKAGVAP